MNPKSICLTLALALSTIAAGAQTNIDTDAATPAAVSQKFTTGWDNFGEPINLAKSYVKWTAAKHKLTVQYKLVGAAPSKVYQVALNFFCDTFPATFGTFPVDLGGGTCFTLTRQNVTATAAEVEIGVVLTDAHGNGAVNIPITNVAPGTYKILFFVRNGTGCNVNGGGGNAGSICSVDFQSPGPWGTGTTVTIP